MEHELKQAFSGEAELRPCPGLCHVVYNPQMFDSATFRNVAGKSCVMIKKLRSLYPDQVELYELAPCEIDEKIRNRLTQLLDPQAKARPTRIEITWITYLKGGGRHMRFYFDIRICVAIVRHIPKEKTFSNGVADIEQWPENIDKDWVLAHQNEITFVDHARQNNPPLSKCSVQ